MNAVGGVGCFALALMFAVLSAVAETGTTAYLVLAVIFGILGAGMTWPDLKG